MDTITLGALAGSVSSLAFSYFPGLKSWFDAQTGDKKALVNLLVLAIVSVGAYLLNCYGYYDLNLACDQQGIVELVKLFFATLVGSQTTWLATRRL